MFLLNFLSGNGFVLLKACQTNFDWNAENLIHNQSNKSKSNNFQSQQLQARVIWRRLAWSSFLFVPAEKYSHLENIGLMNQSTF